MSQSKMDLLFASPAHSGARRGFPACRSVLFSAGAAVAGSGGGACRSQVIVLIKIKRSAQVHLCCFCFFLITPTDGTAPRVAPPTDHWGPSELIKPPGPRGPSGSGPLLAAPPVLDLTTVPTACRRGRNCFLPLITATDGSLLFHFESGHCYFDEARQTRAA